MPFDVDGALQAGYSEDDILGHLRSASPTFDVDGALGSGYSKRDVINYLAPKVGASQSSDASYAPPPARPPLPKGLTEPQDRQAYSIPGMATDPITKGIIRTTDPMRTITQGVEQIAGAGVRTPSAPQGPGLPPTMQRQQDTRSTGQRAAAGASKVIGGVMQGASPLMAPALAAAPLATAVGLGAGMGAQSGTQAGLNALNVPPEYSQLGGDVAGLVAGRAAADMAPNQTVSNLLMKSGAKNYLSALKPGSTNPGIMGQYKKTATQMAQSDQPPTAWTRGRLAKQAAKQTATIGPQTATAYAGAPPVDPQPIYDKIEDLRDQKAAVMGPAGAKVVTNQPLNNALDQIKSNLDDLTDPATGKISQQALDTYKDQLFKGSVDAMGNMRQNAPQVTRTLEKGIADSIKGVLDSANPTAKDINEAYSMWSNIGRALEAQGNRQIVSESNLRTSQGAGAMAKSMMPRPVRAIPQNIAGVFDSVAWNTASGAVKARLAQVIARGQWPGAMAIMSTLPKTGLGAPAGAAGSPTPPTPPAAPPPAAPAAAPAAAPPTPAPARPRIVRGRGVAWPPPGPGTWTGAGALPPTP